VSRNRALKTLQREISDWFHFDLRLDLGQDARRNENLRILRLATKTRSHIARWTYGTVIEPLLEADRADRDVTAGNACSEAKLVTALAPA
jgi:hypothetical protein